MVDNSLFCRLLASFYRWGGRQFEESRLIGWFLGVGAPGQPGIFRHTLDWARNLLSRLFSLLRLDRALKGSLFCYPAFWCALAVALAPILPTMLTLALVAASCGTLLLQLGRDRDVPLVRTPLDGFVWLYAIIYLYATFTSVTVSGSLQMGLLSTVFILFYIVLTNSVRRYETLRNILFCFVLSGVPVSLYGLYQYMNPSGAAAAWVDSDMFSSISFRVYSTLGNPNVLGEFLLLVIPFAFAFFLSAKGKYKKLFFLGTLGVCGLCLILTYSRGCWLSLLLSMALFLVLWDRRFVIVGVAGLLLLPLVAPLILPEAVLDRFLSIGNMADSSTSYRVYIWMGTLAMLKDYWFTGIGPGTAAFNAVYPAYSYNAIAAPHSHNLFLQILCDTGAIGLLVFLGMIVTFFRQTGAALKKAAKGEHRLLLIAGISAIFGFLVQSMTDYTFYNYRVMLLFWAVLGLTMLLTRLRPKEEA